MYQFDVLGIRKSIGHALDFLRVEPVGRAVAPIAADNFSAVSYRSKGLFPRVLARTDARQASASRV